MTKKLDKLLLKSKELAEELKEKEKVKAKVDEEIERLRMKELKSFLVLNNIDLDTDFYCIAQLVKQMFDSGIGADELKEMVGIEDKASNGTDKSDTKKSEARCKMNVQP